MRANLSSYQVSKLIEFWGAKVTAYTAKAAGMADGPLKDAVNRAKADAQNMVTGLQAQLAITP